MNNLSFQLANFSYQYARATASANTQGEKTFLLVLGVVAIVGLIAGIVYYIHETHF